MNEQATLDDVLDAYLASDQDRGSASLAEWIRRYPQYERELTDFAVSWSLMEALPPAPRAEPVDEDTLTLRGISVAQGILHQKRQQRSLPENTAIASLLTEGKARGLSIQALADLWELSAAIVRKLDRRLIYYTSIPRELVENIARTIQREMSVVVRYLQGRPRFAQGASYRAEKAPALTEQEDFFDAVRNDVEMSEDRRRRWLEMKDKN